MNDSITSLVLFVIDSSYVEVRSRMGVKNRLYVKVFVIKGRFIVQLLLYATMSDLWLQHLV